MPELLPHTIDTEGYNNWYAIRLAQCYRPHTPTPTKEELLSLEPYQITGHVTMKNITEQLGLVYKQELKRRGR